MWGGAMVSLEPAMAAASRGAVQETLATVCHGLQADAAVVGLVEEGALRVVAADGPAPTPAPGERLPLEESPWAAPLAGATGGQGAPLRLGGETCGVLTVRRTRPLDAAEQAALCAVADRLAPHVLAPWLQAQLHAERQRGERRLEEQATGFYHDLINPIRHIQTLIQMLREDAPPLYGQPAIYLDRIESSGSTAAAMIERMRQYVHLPRAPEGVQPVDLRALLVDRLAARQLTVSWVGPMADGPVQIQGVSGSLSRLLDEVLDNAVKFCRPDAAPQIQVCIQRLYTEGGWSLSIADAGIGLDMRHKDQIFLPFRRLHPSHAYPGFGLGLAICARIARLHRGRLTVQAVPDQGATFTLILPDR